MIRRFFKTKTPTRNNVGVHLFSVQITKDLIERFRLISRRDLRFKANRRRGNLVSQIAWHLDVKDNDNYPHGAYYRTNEFLKSLISGDIVPLYPYATKQKAKYYIFHSATKSLDEFEFFVFDPS